MMSHQELQATEEMCYHCFDVLVNALQYQHDDGSNHQQQQQQQQRQGGTMKNFSSRSTTSSTTSISTTSTGSSWMMMRPSNFFRNIAGNNNGYRRQTIGSTRSTRATTSTTTTPLPEFVKQLPDPDIECPLFVTWEKGRRSNNNNNNGSNNIASRAGGTIGEVVNLLLPNTIKSNNEQQQQRRQQSPSPDEDGDGEPIAIVSNYELRGCIGTLTAKPLVKAMSDYAITSALRDRRFLAISTKEIPLLRVSVSLLVRYEPCSDCYDWIIGVHGIIIRFYDGVHNADDNNNASSKEYSATYLPEVAQQQCWDQKTTVSSLIRKTGYNGIIDDALIQKISCTRYQSSKYKLTFQEYNTIVKNKRNKKQQQQLVVEENNNHTISVKDNGDDSDFTADTTKSPASTEPSSASSSIHQGPTVMTDDDNDNDNYNYNDDNDNANEQEGEEYTLNHPPKQWNTCNNL